MRKKEDARCKLTVRKTARMGDPTDYMTIRAVRAMVRMTLEIVRNRRRRRRQQFRKNGGQLKRLIGK